MNATGIKWTEKTWNPATGCKQVSPGCAFCYAKTIAEDPSKAKWFPNGFGMTLHPERLQQPKAIKEPSMIFVNSMSDLFWDQIPDDFVDKVMDVIAATPQHRYQILTKRPERMLAYSVRRPLPENVWAGVTIESQAQASRLDVLKKVKGAKIKFISAEPLLSSLVLDWSALDWVIAGGESGAHLKDSEMCLKRGLVWFRDATGQWVPRADRTDWIRGIRDGCVSAKTAFFFKQWGGPWSSSAGNILDEQTWEQYPSDMPRWPTKHVGLVASQLPLF